MAKRRDIIPSVVRYYDFLGIEDRQLVGRYWMYMLPVCWYWGL